MTIARNIEATASNDIDTAAGIQLATGHTDSSPNAALASDGSDAYYGTGNNSGESYVGGGTGKSQKRTHTLSNAQVIWDLAGNVWEWTDTRCDTTTRYAAGGWTEWSDGNLSDIEVKIAGPNGSLTSSNGVGRYFPCTGSGNPVWRGGYWLEGANGGIYTHDGNNAPSTISPALGFRCAYGNVH